MTSKLKSTATFAVKLFVFFIIITILQRTCNGAKTPFLQKNRNFIAVTAMYCYVYDPTWANVTKCILKAVNRNQKLFFGNAVLLKTWKKPILINFRILKRANGGYKPFGIDVSVEGCQYLAGKKNPAIDWFFDMNFRHSNVNHTCPYKENDQVIFKLPIDQVQYPSVFPDGDYRFEFEFGIQRKVRAAVHAYITLKEF